ncbi:uncharacterized protein LAESUDRAFT_809511 [Laetiporus sulphureus 93-53]|uniref:Uncharacterized protein n=1 Tax=Laetiporus sulphureus 93-53 TaxID=1314785 RepID=A0A165HE86_9APHY|nr:uncharacterized protein LAESUDRAFT_809511 [Laetiporus sulphureus 93-53]KZT11620.1 hypothetical protein LAESUDRAFT_809511 [Laetiporus sulphureus 93-53]
MAYAYYQAIGRDKWGTPEFRFERPPTPNFKPEGSWGGIDYFRAHACHRDPAFYHSIIGRMSAAIGVGFNEARYWHHRIYGGLVNLAQVPPADVGAAAAYEAYRIYKHRRSVFFHPLGRDIERHREMLIAMAIAEATQLWQYTGRALDAYGRQDAAEAAAATASQIARRVCTRYLEHLHRADLLTGYPEKVLVEEAAARGGNGLFGVGAGMGAGGAYGVGTGVPGGGYVASAPGTGYGAGMGFGAGSVNPIDYTSPAAMNPLNYAGAGTGYGASTLDYDSARRGRPRGLRRASSADSLLQYSGAGLGMGAGGRVAGGALGAGAIPLSATGTPASGVAGLLTMGGVGVASPAFGAGMPTPTAGIAASVPTAVPAGVPVAGAYTAPAAVGAAGAPVLGGYPVGAASVVPTTGAYSTGPVGPLSGAYGGALGGMTRGVVPGYGVPGSVGQVGTYGAYPGQVVMGTVGMQQQPPVVTIKPAPRRHHDRHRRASSASVGY